ncbi:hypothetical protein ACH9DO_11410 [Kocuria sp. M1N1S27]|uniref:hypothetical protein n=1 Tax=Kocuria kalidii TaxID=3376283 RepID=UPI0037B803BF
MNQPALQTDEVSVPTARRVAMRTLPTALVMAAGLPLVLWVQLLDSTGQARSYWWLAALVVVSALCLLVHHFARAPRPRLAPGVAPVQLKSTLASAARTGTVPQDPDVRVTVGVIACRGVETQTAAATIVVATVLSALVLPGNQWFAALGVAVAVVLVATLRTRHSWAYLRVLHNASRNGSEISASSSSSSARRA